MTIKTTMLSTVAAIALAMPAIAQSTDTDTEAEVETPVIEADVDAETETDADVGVDTDAEADAEVEVDAEADTDTDLATGDLMEDRDVRDTSVFAGMSVGDIVGMDVHSTAGEGENDVGEIDYIIQAADGYEAVIGIGGFLGLGEYTVALPLGAFSINPEDENQLLLDGFTEEELEAMPEIDESELEALPDDHVIG